MNALIDELLRKAEVAGYRPAHDLVHLSEVSRFCMIVEQGRHVWGGRSVSWGRSPEFNAAQKGSHPKSLHQWGLADDQIFPTGAARAGAWRFYQAAGFGGYLRGDGLSLHVQRWPKGQGPRPEPSHEVPE